MYYECDLNDVTVACQIIEWDQVTGQCLIEYTDQIGLLRIWVNGGRIKERTPLQEISL